MVRQARIELGHANKKLDSIVDENHRFTARKDEARSRDLGTIHKEAPGLVRAPTAAKVNDAGTHPKSPRGGRRRGAAQNDGPEADSPGVCGGYCRGCS